MRRSLRVLAYLVVAGCAALTRSATAGTVYSASSELKISLHSILDANDNPLDAVPEGVDARFLAMRGEIVETLGTGFATASSSGLLNGVDPIADFSFTPLKLGDYLVQNLSASGGTIASSDSAVSLALYGAWFYGMNSTSNDYTLRLELTYNYQIASTVSDPSREFAFAHELILAIDGTGDELLVVQDHVQFTAASSGSGTTYLNLRLSAESFNSLGVVHLAGGDPPPVAPEPTTWMLAVCGAALLGSRRCQRVLRREPAETIGR